MPRQFTATSTMREIASKYAKGEGYFCGCLLTFLVVGDFFIWKTPYEEFESEGMLRVNSLPDQVAIATLIVGALILGLAIRRIFCREKLGWLFCGTSLLSPLCCGLGEFRNGFLMHQEVSTVMDSQGREYRLFRWDGLQGSDFDLVRLESRGFGFEKFRILASGPTKYEDDGSTADFLDMVRPSGQAQEREFRLVAGRYILEAPDSRRTVFAYDTVVDRAYSVECSDSHSDPRSTCFSMKQLSPFVELGESDTPNEDDFKELMKCEEHGCPTPDAIVADLQNPNPRVRDMVQTLLERLLERTR